MRVLAIVFFLFAALALVWDLVRWGGKGPVYLADLGTDWYALHPASLQLAQPAVQRYLSPALWDSFIQPVLLVPAVLLFGGLGLVFLLLHALTSGGRRRRSS